jgi:hypothetical protein
MMNFCESAGLRFDSRLIIRVSMFGKRASDRRHLFTRRHGMLRKNFRSVMRKFCCSLSPLGDFGTTPHVRYLHFFLDFIFH